MAKGDYAAAEELAAKGKEIRQFQSEVKALRARWLEVCQGADVKAATTSLWEYFQPILEALVNLGGEASRSDLEAQVERLITVSLLPGDRAPMMRGLERWRVMIQRARKPLVTEGWLEARGGRIWRITDMGRQAAQQPMSKYADQAQGRE